MLISILTSVIVFVTMVATTFAWVGIFTYASTDSFQMNLKVSELDSNYYLTISSDGKKDNFSDSVSTINLQRQILNEKYDFKYANVDDSTIEKLFSNLVIAPSTTTINSDNTFSTFEEVNYNYGAFNLQQSKSYYKFDIYLSVNTKEGITSDTTGIKANVFLTNLAETLVGTIHEDMFSDINPFINMPSNPINDLLRTIPKKFSVDSKNACRFGFSIYNPIDINDEYVGTELPEKSLIFQGGNEMPYYNETTDVYDLGGCLPEDQNTAIQEILKIRPDYTNSSADLFYSKLNQAMNRGDLVLTEENSLIWNRNEQTKYLGIMDGIQTKMKVSVYFWFEGWDADCLRHIEMQPVTLNLTFTSGTDN